MKATRQMAIACLAFAVIALSYWLGYQAGNVAGASNAPRQFVVNSHPWPVNSWSGSPRLMFIEPSSASKVNRAVPEAEPRRTVYVPASPRSPIPATQDSQRSLPPALHAPKKLSLDLIDDTKPDF